MATSIIKSPLANITQDFWRVSLAYRKRAEGSNSLTVIQAIRLMNNLLNNSGEHRLLHRRALYLQHYIICGEELTNEEKGTDKA